MLRILIVFTLIFPFVQLTAQSLNLQFSEHEALTGDTVCVDLQATNFDGIATLQFSIQWQPEVMQFIDNESVLDNPLVSDAQAENGILQISWLDLSAQGVTFSDSVALFKFCFLVTGQGDIETDITITDQPTAIEVTRFDGTDLQFLDIEQDPGSVQVFTCNPISIGADTIICPSTNLQLNAGTGGRQYRWFESGAEQLVTDSILLVDGAGLFVVEKLIASVCILRDTIEVDLEAVPLAHLQVNEQLAPTTLCAPERLILDGTGFDSIQWYRNNQSLPTSMPTFLPTQAGQYYAIVTSQKCGLRDTTSTVIILEQDTTFVENTSCAIDVFQTDTVLLQSINGCDSIVITETLPLPNDVTEVFTTSCNPQDTGQFETMLTNQFGCDSLVRTTIQLSAIDSCSVEFLVQPAAPNCAGETGTITFVLLTGLAPYTLFWENEQGDKDSLQINEASDTIRLSDLTPGTYDVVINSANGNQFQQTVSLTEPTPVQLSIEVLNENSCGNDTAAVVRATGIGGTPPYDFKWNTGDTSPYLENLAAGNYQLTITDNAGCSSRDSIELESSETLEVQLVFTELSCQTSYSTLRVTHAESAPLLYSINGGQSFSPDSIFFQLQSGAYDVVVESMEGCRFQENIIIEPPKPLVVELPENSTIALGDSILLQTITNRPPSTIKWTPADYLSCLDCLTPFASPINTTDYNIEIQDSLGCTASGTVKITVDKTKIAYIPNAFSPNGDGQNDFFQIYPTSAVEKIEVFQIFSEWGELLYESAEPLLDAASWDGTFRQQRAAIGTYVYHVQLQLKDQRLTTLSGEIHLNR